MAILIIIIIFVALVLFWQISTLISVFGGIHYVGTKAEDIKESLTFAGLKKGDKFYELGSGLGNGLIIAAQEFGARATGIEISPFHYLISKLKTLGNKNIKIILANYKKIDLAGADVVYCYLLPRMLSELLPKFSQELKPGAKVISYAFKMQGQKPIKINKINSKYIYLYKF